MINPQNVNVLELPWTFLKQKRELPACCGIYFAINSVNEILYIGRSVNINIRWQCHHRYEQLKQMKGVRIAWLELSDELLLPEIELALIEWFSPSLNRPARQNRLAKSNKDNRVSPGSWGESKVRINIMLTPTLIQMVDAVADQLGLTRSEVLERLGRTQCLNVETLRNIEGTQND